MRRDVFQAIADPTRRAIINRIAHHPLNVNAVSEQFDVSRAAVYKHIKILTECGLIVIRQQGRERFCEARLGQLSEVSDWVEQYRQLWTRRFDALDEYLRVLQAKDTAQPAAAKSTIAKSTAAKSTAAKSTAAKSTIAKPTTGKSTAVKSNKKAASANKKTDSANKIVPSASRKIESVSRKIESASKNVASANKKVAARRTGSGKIADIKKVSPGKRTGKGSGNNYPPR